METNFSYDINSSRTTVHQSDLVNPFSFTKKYELLLDIEKSILMTPGQDKVSFKALSESKNFSKNNKLIL